MIKKHRKFMQLSAKHRLFLILISAGIAFYLGLGLKYFFGNIIAMIVMMGIYFGILYGVGLDFFSSLEKKK